MNYIPLMVSSTALARDINLINLFLLLSGHDHVQRAVADFRHRRSFGIMVEAHLLTQSSCCNAVSTFLPFGLGPYCNLITSGPTVKALRLCGVRRRAERSTARLIELHPWYLHRVAKGRRAASYRSRGFALSTCELTRAVQKGVSARSFLSDARMVTALLSDTCTAFVRHANF